MNYLAVSKEELAAGPCIAESSIDGLAELYGSGRRWKRKQG
jgi:hypothetical protein